MHDSRGVLELDAVSVSCTADASSSQLLPGPTSTGLAGEVDGYDSAAKKTCKNSACVTCLLCLWLLSTSLLLALLLDRRLPLKDVPDWAIWSKGPLPFTEYQMKGTETAATREELRDRLQATVRSGSHVIWVRAGNSGKTHDIDLLAKLVEAAPFEGIVVVMSDGDRPVPSSVQESTVTRLLGSSKVLAWYTQNYDGSLVHPKLHPWPIGLDLHTPGWCGEARNADVCRFRYALFGPGMFAASKVEHLLALREARLPTRRPLTVLCDTCREHAHRGSSPIEVSEARTDWTGGADRRAAADALYGVPHVHVPDHRMSQADIWQLYTEHPFVISPRANGLDCHRTWELLHLGTIPIVTYAHKELFDGLPVVLVRNWSEAADPAKLSQWHSELAPLLKDPAYVRRKIRCIALRPWSHIGRLEVEPVSTTPC